MQTYLEVIPDGVHWVVRCHSAEYGRFRTQVQALNTAVAEARRIREAGRMARVRVVRDGAYGGDFLCLL
jgi:hypothetical protein